MSLIDQRDAIQKLSNAFRSKNLTLYLGAGVSVPSGLPNWEQLVLLLYFRNLNADIEYRVFPNYLLAIAEWLLKNKKEPLDIILRKIKSSGWDDQTFLKLIRKSLYSGFNLDDISQQPRIEGNKTLNSIIHWLCPDVKDDLKGLKSVISYNYDNLLEIGLKSRNKIDSYQVIWKRDVEIRDNKIPIYHVHGFLPFRGEGSTVNEMIFSEEQYNSAFQDAYYWGNMIQMQHLAASTGLMIGISLNDRNIRRILDAIKRSPIRTTNYLLLKRDNLEIPQEPNSEIKWIHNQASNYRKKLSGSGAKVEEKEFGQIVDILRDISRFESTVFNNIYENMGINVLWYDDHDEVADFIQAISN